MPELSINGARHGVDPDPAMPLLHRDGPPAAWRHRHGIVDLPFDDPGARRENREAATHVRPGTHRPFVNRPFVNGSHAFDAGSCVDERAAAAGKDPLQYLLSLLGDRHNLDPLLLGDGAAFDRYPINVDRLRNVLLLAAARSGWRSPLPARHGRGIAVHRSLESHVAVVAHVAVADDGTVSVPRLDMAVDCGKVVGPDRVAAAFEGAAVMSIGNTLGCGLNARNRRREVPRIDATPDTRGPDTHVYVVRSEEPPGGIGEPGMPPVAVAIANGIFAATNQRVRALPVDPGLLRTAST